MTTEFLRLWNTFQDQYKALGITSQRQITEGFRSDFGDFHRDGRLYIKLQNRFLLRDFEYLTIFGDRLKTLVFVSNFPPGDEGYVQLGPNLHKCVGLERLFLQIKVTGNNHDRLDGFPDDFDLLTPQLKQFHITTYFNIKNRTWRWPALKVLKVGDEHFTSNTDFKWCQNIPTLETVSFIGIPNRDFNIFNIAPNATSVTVNICNLGEIGQSFLRLQSCKKLTLRNIGIRDVPIATLDRLPALKSLDLSNYLSHTHNTEFRNVFNYPVVLDHRIANLESINLSWTDANDVTIDLEVRRPLSLKQLYVSSDTIFGVDEEEEEEFVPRGNLKITPNNGIDGDPMLQQLEVVVLSSNTFFLPVLSQPNLRSYEGGYSLAGTFMLELNFDNVACARNHPEKRAEIYNSLANDNQDVEFFSREFGNQNVRGAQELVPAAAGVAPALAFNPAFPGFTQNDAENMVAVARTFRLEPYACYVANEELGAEDKCNICYDALPKPESTPNAWEVSQHALLFCGLGIAVREGMELQYTTLNCDHAVCCNALERNVKEQFPAYDSDQVTAELRQHQKHRFHLKCFARWIVAGNHNCPIARTLF